MEKFKVIGDVTGEIVSVGELQEILNTNAAEISKLCQKACLRPKKDNYGNAYFSKDDIDVLKKVKELYEHTAQIQAKRQQEAQKSNAAGMLPGNFLTRTKSKHKNEPDEGAHISIANVVTSSVTSSLASLENNIIERINGILSEKMDGLDEVVLELIRAKTENEALRQKLNELNKENFNLKNENTSYKSIGLGLYLKKNTDDFIL